MAGSRAHVGTPIPMRLARALTTSLAGNDRSRLRQVVIFWDKKPNGFLI
jgi:hypothetical protein